MSNSSLPTAVRKMIVGPGPVISILTEAPTAAGSKPPVELGVGTIIEKLTEDVVLAVTCRHVVVPPEGAADNIFCGRLIDTEGEREGFEVLGQPVIDPEHESDIAFMLLKTNNVFPVKPLKLHQWNRPIRRANVYVCQHRIVNEIPLAVYPVKIEGVSEAKGLHAHKYSNRETIKRVGTDEEMSELRKDGWVPCRIFKMPTSPGYSGSPVWDDRMNYYGMVFASNSSSITMCVPSSEIIEARKRADTGLNAALRKVA